MQILRRIYKVLFEDTGDAMSIKISNTLKSLWTKYRLLYKGVDTKTPGAAPATAASVAAELAAFSSVSAAASVSSESVATAASAAPPKVVTAAAGPSAGTPTAAPLVMIKKELVNPKPGGSVSNTAVGVKLVAPAAAPAAQTKPAANTAKPPVVASAVVSAAPAVSAASIKPTTTAVTAAATTSSAAPPVPAAKPALAVAPGTYLNISINSGNGNRVAPPPRQPSPPTPQSTSSNPPTTVAPASAAPPTVASQTSAPKASVAPVTSAQATTINRSVTLPQAAPVKGVVVNSAIEDKPIAVAPSVAAIPPPSSSNPLSALNDAIPNMSVLLIQLKQINTYPSMYSAAMQLFNRMKVS